MINVDTLFQQTAHAQPGHVAIVDDGRDESTNYIELDRAIENASEVLEQEGIQHGDSVAVHIPSGIDYIVFCYALWRRGACIVPIPVELAVDEKQEILREIHIDWLVSTGSNPEFAEPFQNGPAASLPRGGIAQKMLPSRQHPVGFRDINAAFIRFTSGTTGTSKGVVLSHETIHDRIIAANTVLRIDSSDRILWVLSMSYHFTVSIVGYLTFGATIVLPRNSLPQELVASIRNHSATFLYASPVHYTLLADWPRAQLLPSLRLAISTATTLESQIARKFHARYGVPVSQALGLIEVGLPAINIELAADRPEAVGRILPDYRLRLDRDGKARDGSDGEILLRGPGFLDAYYEPWQLRSEIMPDGWFHTGDIGHLDADGCLFVRGRSKDVINVMGMKFFPREVEEVLETHPAVKEARVFSAKSSRFGEIPGAEVVVDPNVPVDADELIRFCRRFVAEFKVPHRIDIVDHVARTASGKLLRRNETREHVIREAR